MQGYEKTKHFIPFFHTIKLLGFDYLACWEQVRQMFNAVASAELSSASAGIYVQSTAIYAPSFNLMNNPFLLSILKSNCLNTLTMTSSIHVNQPAVSTVTPVSRIRCSSLVLLSQSLLWGSSGRDVSPVGRSGKSGMKIIGVTHFTILK